MLVRRLTCPSCGAPLDLNGENSQVTCAYCSTQLLVQRDHVSRQPAPSPAAAQVVRRPVVSSAANASLIFGCAAWFLVPFMGALAAVALGHVARREIAAADGRLTGGTRALVGLTLGYMQLGLLALGIILYAVKGPAG